jgi:hypothetical protein
MKRIQLNEKDSEILKSLEQEKRKPNETMKEWLLRLTKLRKKK